MNRTRFYIAVRPPLFSGRMSEPQVSGCEAILDGWEARGGGWRQWLSYMLATALHETAHTMQPIAEYGHGKGRAYGKPGKHGGQVAYGRGLVQTTWDINYERTDRELGLGGALIANYDLLLTLPVAVPAMMRGMIEGWYTKRTLASYLYPGHTDFIGARRVINGQDRAELIAGYAEHFDEAILAAVA